jgi:hypothetical protein
VVDKPTGLLTQVPTCFLIWGLARVFARGVLNVNLCFCGSKGVLTGVLSEFLCLDRIGVFCFGIRVVFSLQEDALSVRAGIKTK